MNLHELASGAINTVNPNRPLTVIPATGYTTKDDGTQVPVYGAPIHAQGQMQDLSHAEIMQTAGLNIQNITRVVYLNGQWNGVIRRDSRGGDKVVIDGQTWIVVTISEQWPTWSRLIVTLQTD